MKKNSSQVKKQMIVFSLVLLSLCPSVFAGNPHDVISEHTVKLSTGIDMEYAERGTGNGKVVIFIHGYLDSWFAFSQVMDSMHKKYHSYSLSLRGFGDTDKPSGSYSMETHAADVIAFMNHKNIHKATIVGHSMGSIIAQRIGIDHSDRVKNLVLIGAGVDMTTNPILLAFEEIAATLSDPINPGFVDELFVGLEPGFQAALNQETLKVPAAVWVDALAGLQAANYLTELNQISAPTLIVWGEDDVIFSEQEQDVLLEEIPNSTLVVFEDTGHGVQWEQLEAFTEVFEDFLH